MLPRLYSFPPKIFIDAQRRRAANITHGDPRAKGTPILSPALIAMFRVLRNVFVHASACRIALQRKYRLSERIPRFAFRPSESPLVRKRVVITADLSKKISVRSPFQVGALPLQTARTHG
jgi:hypothetical protein